MTTDNLITWARDESALAARAAHTRMMRDGGLTPPMHVYFRPGHLAAFAEGDQLPPGWARAWPEHVPTDRTADQLVTWFAERAGRVPYLPTSAPTCAAVAATEHLACDPAVAPAASPRTIAPDNARPKCSGATQICSGQAVRSYSVNGSARKGETFPLCLACAAYLRSNGSKVAQSAARRVSK